MKVLITFFSLAYVISWTIWLPLYGQVFGLTNLPQLPFHHGLGGLGPLLAALLTTSIYFKKVELHKLLSSCFQIKPFRYLAIALLAPFALLLIASVMSNLLSGSEINLDGILSSKEFPRFDLVTFFLYNLFFFGFGEEVGWRGFALPIFQKKFNPFVATVVLTVFWALWHLPLFFYRPGYLTMDLPGIIGWILSLLTGSVLLTWLFNSSKGSILVCAVFHATIDIVFTADMADKNVVNYMGFLITLWGILTILIFKPKNLGRSTTSTR